METRPTALRAGAAVLSAALVLTGCGKSIDTNESAVTVTTTKATSAEPEAVPADEEIVTTVKESAPDVKEVAYEKYSKTIEAELGAASGNAAAASKREGFSGDGYLTGFKEQGDRASYAFDLKASQFYTITIRAAADKQARLAVSVGDSIRYVSTDSKKFTDLHISNIYLEEGALSLDIGFAEGSMDVDSITVTASDDIEKLDLTLKNAALSNKNADPNAKALYSYICNNSGAQVLLGQYDSIGTTIETESIFKFTGKYPAIRFGDLMTITTDDPSLSEKDIENSISWHDEGGIVGLMWHWYAPCEDSDYYADKTSFDLSKAVAKTKVSQLSTEEIKALVKDKKITRQCADLIADIDTAAEKLKVLQEKGIAVLWRPLHEASNGYFWWGKDEKSYIWLWQLMYNRMTKYHGLNNLIWVWSAQNAGWYVGDDYCDILSVDIYDKGNLSGQTDRLLFLKSISSSKPAAMSECGNLPSAELMMRDKGFWSYIGQWGGNFLLRDDGSLETEYNTSENLLDIYNSTLTVTRDELPDLSALAAEIEKADAEIKEKTEKAEDTKKEEKTDESSEKE